MNLLARAGHFLERLVSLAFAAGAGALAGGILSDGEEGAVVAGAVIGAGLLLAAWTVGSLRRGAARHLGPAEIGTIVSITSTPPPGAPWYHHTYVLVDIRGKRHKLKLTPEQAREFSEKISEGDVGRIAFSGRRLLTFTPVSPSAPMREKKGIKAFVSYAHGNDPEGQMAEYVAEVLESSGIEPWLDKSEVEPGQKLRSDVVGQIQQSNYFVPLLSREYMASEWCLREFETAAEAGIPMTPIKIWEGRLVPPPYLRSLYEEKAGEPAYLDMSSRNAPRRLREMAESMAQSA